MQHKDKDSIKVIGDQNGVWPLAMHSFLIESSLLHS